MLKANPELRGRTWVTRPDVHIDRMASAWFIRRFIDAKARCDELSSDLYDSTRSRVS